MYIEKYTQPLGILKDDGSIDSEEEINKALKIVKAIQSSTAIYLPTGFQLDFANFHTSQGRVGIYDEAIRRYDEAIVTYILGQSLVTTTGKRGSYSLGKVHEQVFYLYLNYVKKKLENVINKQLIKRLIEWNFVDYKDEEIPQFRLKLVRGGELRELVELYNQVSKLIPITEIDEAYIREKLGMKARTKEDIIIKSPVMGKGGGLFSDLAEGEEVEVEVDNDYYDEELGI
jgi:phage gp29-like protein